MQRIDFLGLPGVGKTTLYEALLLGRMRAGRTWLTLREAKFLVARSLAWHAGLRGKINAFRLYLPGLRGGLVDVYARKAAKRAMADNAQEWDTLLLSGEQEWDALLELFGRAPDKHSGQVREKHEHGATLIQSLHITKAAPDIALLRAMPMDRAVLFDNSLTQRVCEAASFDADPACRVRYCLERLPLPAGAIHMHDDIETIVRNIMSRQAERYGLDAEGRVSLLYSRMGPDDLYKFASVMKLALREAEEVLQAHSVPVLTLDARTPLSDQAEQVDLFLRSLK